MFNIINDKIYIFIILPIQNKPMQISNNQNQRLRQDPLLHQQQSLIIQKRRQQQLHNAEQNIRNNLQRIKTPIQKFQGIPYLRLDEGICDSVRQQFKGMCLKISYVLLPRSNSNSSQLRNWDLWGPFFMIVVYAFFIDNSMQLLMLFFSLLIGALVVTFNVVALGGRVSFFQTFSILSYCIFPIFACVLAQKVLTFFQLKSRAITVLFITMAVIWSIIAVRVFIGVNVQENRKFVAVYPAAIYYIFVGVILGFNY